MKVTGILFDMDGTITRPFLNFDRIRQEMGGIKGPILEAMAKMTPERRGQVEAILRGHEERAADQSELNPGVRELLSDLAQQGRSVGLITRNCRASVEKVCRKHAIAFEGIVTRENGPVKPDPFGFLLACRRMGVAPDQSIMVGDYLFDLICGRRGGGKAVLLCNGKSYQDYLPEADFAIGHLNELPQIISDLEKG